MGFEYYPKQPVLSPRDEEEIPAQKRAERGKKRKRAVHINHSLC